MNKRYKLIALTGIVFLAGCESLNMTPPMDPVLVESNARDSALLVNRYHNIHYWNKGFYPNGYYQNGNDWYQRGYRY